MLYKDLLTNWLTDKKIYLKYSTYTNYYNIIHTHLLPKLGEYGIPMLYVSRNKLLCTAAQYQ